MINKTVITTGHATGCFLRMKSTHLKVISKSQVRLVSHSQADSIALSFWSPTVGHVHQVIKIEVIVEGARVCPLKSPLVRSLRGALMRINLNCLIEIVVRRSIARVNGVMEGTVDSGETNLNMFS